MCFQEVLGLKDLENVRDSFHEDFIDELKRLEDGTYCTKLPWKPDHASLPSNKELTVGRLRSVTRKLERMQRLEEYHTVNGAAVRRRNLFCQLWVFGSLLSNFFIDDFAARQYKNCVRILKGSYIVKKCSDNKE